ncbi:MAG: hypothetical protein Q4G58_08360 [bacterium]|nr:hypothetical protein [bacterium]
MERFHEKEVTFPKTKAFIRGNTYMQALEKVIVPGKILLQISSYQEKNSLMLELYRILSSSSEFSMNQLVLCIKEASKTMKTSMAHLMNVSIVEEDSDEYIEHLATAEFIFSNENLPTYFLRREGQSLLVVPGPKREYRVSFLLNATCLVSFSESYTKLVYQEEYHLDGIYKGQVAEPRLRTSLKEYAFCLIQMFLIREQCNAVVSKYLLGRKKRILFVVDPAVQELDNLGNYLFLLQQMDDTYETVLLLTSKQEGVEAILRRMLPRVHIIVKQGKVSYSDAGYIRLERMRYLFSHCEEINTVFEDRPEQELSMEWHRLLGTMTFEQAYLLSPHTVFWYAMFLEVASLKVGVFPTKDELSLLTCLNEKKTERIYNNNTNASLCRFDKIVLFQEIEIENLYARQTISPEKICLIDPEYGTVKAEKSVKMVQIGPLLYYEWGFRKTSGQTYAGTFLLAKQEGEKSLLIYGKEPESFLQESFWELIERLKKEKGIRVYISVPCTTVEQINTQLEISKECLQSVTVIYAYLLTEELVELMDTLVVIGEESKKIRYLSQLQKKPYIRLEDAKDVETFMEYLHGEPITTLHQTPYMTPEEYLCCEKQEIRKLLT